jgi:very-short-patch-repair endonuclease
VGALAVPIVEALAQACRCQLPRDAIATLESAWCLRLVDTQDIDAVFDRLPRRYRVLRRLLQPGAESGPETLVRLALRALGCRVKLQVAIDGVGRVDMVVDGWLIVECDSKAFHSSWEQQRADRRRDAAAARLGYVTLRLLAEDILFRHDETVELLRDVVRQVPRRIPRT